MSVSHILPAQKFILRACAACHDTDCVKLAGSILLCISRHPLGALYLGISAFKSDLDFVNSDVLFSDEEAVEFHTLLNPPGGLSKLMNEVVSGYLDYFNGSPVLTHIDLLESIIVADNYDIRDILFVGGELDNLWGLIASTLRLRPSFDLLCFICTLLSENTLEQLEHRNLMGLIRTLIKNTPPKVLIGLIPRLNHFSFDFELVFGVDSGFLEEMSRNCDDLMISEVISIFIKNASFAMLYRVWMEQPFVLSNYIRYLEPPPPRRRLPLLVNVADAVSKLIAFGESLRLISRMDGFGDTIGDENPFVELLRSQVRVATHRHRHAWPQSILKRLEAL